MSNTHLPAHVAARLQRVLKSENDLMVGQMAVRLGFINADQLAQALVEQATSPERRLGAILLERGWITPDDLVSIMEEQRSERFTRQAQSLAAEMPDVVRGLLHDPARNIDEYVLVEGLGRGGTGEVWKAWDRRLNRWVAVKVPALLPDSEMSLDRFHREAMAAARLSHPNIVAIHRVAQHRAMPYIVMQLIDGTTLDRNPMPIRRAVEIARTVARALDHAHQQGVVHRDLKPHNIMLDSKGGVWVLDFGLAHLRESKRMMTTEGTAIGTPAYMSPEQARGEARAKEPATDIYSLGATLYELTTGRPPFQGDSVPEIVRNVSDVEPVAPRRRNPEIPRDVETIILKAMDKEPGRRYATAVAFADDLQRVLDDEPIAARPQSAMAAWARRIRKNPAAYGLGLAAGVCAAAVFALWSIAESDRTDALVTMRDIARSSVDRALALRREGKNDAMAALLPPLEAAYRGASRRAPDLAEIEYLMGRMQRALMNDDEALECQERALKKDPSYAPARYERAVLRSKNYGRRFERASQLLRVLSGPVTPESARSAPSPTREDVERAWPELAALRREIVADCEALQRAQLGDAGRLAAEGLLAFHTGQFDSARRALEEAVKKEPQMEEAWEALGLLAGSLAKKSKDWSEKDQGWREAEARYTEALSHDRGYLPHWIGRGRVRIYRGVGGWGRGQDPLWEYAAAEEDFSQALKLDERSVAALTCRGLVRSCRAVYIMDRGQDPQSTLASAEEDLVRALRLEPKNVEAWIYKGRVHANRGSFENGRGRDPLPEWSLAEEAQGQVIELSRELPEGWSGRGHVRFLRGVFLKDAGKDPKAEWERAESDFAEALRRSRDQTYAWVSRGQLRIDRGVYRENHGSDPLPDYAAAEEDFSEAMRLDPQAPDSWFKRGVARTDRGVYRKNHGGDPLPDWVAALKDFDEALLRNKEDARLWVARGQGRANIGNYRLAKGEDPLPSFAEAEEDLSAALQVNSACRDAWVLRGKVRANRGVYKFGHGLDPISDWAEAEKDLKRSLEIDAKLADAWVTLGQLHGNRGLAQKESGFDPSKEYESAESELTRALELNPEMTEALAARAQVRNQQGTFGWHLDRDPIAVWAASEEDYGRALKIDRRSPELWIHRGQLRVNRGTYRSDKGEDPSSDWAAAESDFTEALGLNAEDPEAWKSRGALRINRGANRAERKLDPLPDWEAGEEDLSQALARNKGSADLWMARGMVRANRGIYLRNENGDPLAAWASAEGDLNEALRLNPRLAEAWMHRGTLNWNRGERGRRREDYAAAARDYAEALRLNPSLEGPIGDRLEQARRKSSEDY